MTNNGQTHSVVKGFTFSAVFWLIVGLLVGLWIAAEKHRMLDDDSDKE